MPELFRNYVSEKSVTELAKRISTVFTEFRSKQFCAEILPFPQELSLTNRLSLVSTTLDTFLPQDFETASGILVDSLGPELDSVADDPAGNEYDSNRGFIVMALTEFISRNGVDHLEISMNALKEMTKRFSSEGSIRVFLIHYPEQSLEWYHRWANDANVHVRRLVSESTRPRLPWTQQLPQFIKDPHPVFELLEKLKNDAHLYVRRSVANNLNDISKDNPQLVLDTLSRWSSDQSKEMKWLIKHALRTLEKKGNPQALEILGYSPTIALTVDSFALNSPVVTFGTALEFTLSLSSETNEKLLIDYIVYHQKANGTITPKVFKWTKRVISNGTLTLSKKHLFKEISTRKYYAGHHEIHIQINGKIFAKADFELVM